MIVCRLKIVSGGQTGADRGGLRAAMARGFETGGVAPAGWRSEDGKVPLDLRAGLVARGTYTSRTRENIEGADCTILFTRQGTWSPGSNLTERVAREIGHQLLLVELPDSAPNLVRIAHDIRAFLRMVARGKTSLVVNVSGSRESRCPGIEREVERVLLLAFIAVGGEA